MQDEFYDIRINEKQRLHLMAMASFYQFQDLADMFNALEAGDVLNDLTK